MKVLKVSSTSSGGAFIAAQRQCEALNLIGIECTLLNIEHNWSIDSTASGIDPVTGEATLSPMMIKYKFGDEIAENYFETQRTPMSNSPISLWRKNSETNAELIAIVESGGYTHIHFHFAHQLLNSELLATLKAKQVPTFITCHDMFYFTGGCHYSASCERYLDNCSGCPQVANDPFNLIVSAFNEKAEAFSSTSAHFIFPSQWLNNEFSKSKIGSQVAENQRHTIRNCLDQSIFIPARKLRVRELRATFGIPADSIVIVAGAVDNTEKRKGFELLKTVLLIASSALAKRQKPRQFTLITFGVEASSKLIKTQHVDQISLGQLAPEAVRDVMQCADLLLFTSSQDNYPNIVLEAIHCGTLTLASHSGGTQELLRDTPHVYVNTGSLKSDALRLAEILAGDDLEQRIRRAKIPSKQFLHENAPATVGKKLAQLYRSASC